MSVEAFHNGIRSAVRGLWMGVLDFAQFYDAMQSAIGRGLTQAWAEGAAQGGVTPDEYSTEENSALAQLLVSQYEQIQPFGLYIMAHNREKGGALEPLLSRAELWVNQYRSAVVRAAAMAAKDEKRVWILGATKAHCDSCKRLNGIVKRYSFWLEHVLPGCAPNDNLRCGGYRCGCELRPTRRPISKGPLPKLP